ncbi:putative cation efflux system membrane protein B [Chlamydiales bacterium STE3]|nr:putative cation efflux system membrane protein B [Chlamydiales bacterium STE3]
MALKKILFYGLLTAFFGGAAVYTVIPNKQHAPPEIEKTEEAHTHETLLRFNDEQIRKMGITIAEAGSGKLAISLTTRGKIILHPDHLAHVIPKISGLARKAAKNIGNQVEAGELMAILESREMADIKANYLSALSRLRLTASVLDREERLYQERIAAQEELLNAKNQHEEALINVELALQKLKAFGIAEEEIEQLEEQINPDLRLYALNAPISGTVIMRHITQGEFIENTTIIYEIADLNKVWVEIGIFPKDIYRVRKGQVVEIIDPLDDKIAQAKMLYVSPIISDETIAAKAIAELDNPKGYWKPGAFVKINIPTERTSAPIVVPKEAIQGIPGKEFMFLVTPNGIEKKDVKLGISDGQNAAITSGLTMGDRYIANKTFLLKAELEKNSIEHDD